MALPRIDKGLVVSGSTHAAVLLWAAVSFGARPLEPKQVDSVFVETISASEFSEMTAGIKTAPKKETPKKLVEKVAEPKPVEDAAAKVVEKKPEIRAAAAPPEPPPPPKLEEPKKEPPKQAAKKEPDRKPPPLDAEALKREIKKETKKEEAKKEEAKPAPRKPDPPKMAERKPAPPQEQRLDLSKISALLDKRQPQRLAATGDAINTMATLGTASGNAPKLSQNEMDALRARLQQCWNPPAGQADARELVVEVRILFNRDGSLAADPRVVSRVASGYQQVAAESALRAVRRCAPYTFLPVAKYEAWKDVEVTFDPRDLFRG